MERSTAMYYMISGLVCFFLPFFILAMIKDVGGMGAAQGAAFLILGLSIPASIILFFIGLIGYSTTKIYSNDKKGKRKKTPHF